MTDINTLKLSPVQHQVKTALTDRELSKISALIYQRAGIVLSPQKRDMVYNRLSRRLRELRLASFTAYTDRLEADSHSDEWQVFINALTTNLTSFFVKPTISRCWPSTPASAAAAITCGVPRRPPAKSPAPSP